MGMLGMGLNALRGAAETGVGDLLKEGEDGLVSGAANTAGSDLVQSALTPETAAATPGGDSGAPSGTDGNSSPSLLGSVVDTAEHAVGDVAKGVENGVSDVGKAIGDVFKSIF